MSTESKIGDPILRELFTYWYNKGSLQDIPTRAAIDPTEMPRLLPHIMLVEPNPVDTIWPEDLHYRLVGTEIERVYGRSLTGFRFSDVFTEKHRRFACSLISRVLEAGRPIYGISHYGHEHLSFVVHRLILPLRNAQGLLTPILIGQTFRFIDGLEPKVILTAVESDAASDHDWEMF